MITTKTVHGLTQKHHHHNGQLTIETIQECQGIVDDNKILRNSSDGYSESRNMKKVATVPVIFIDLWAKESGLTIGTREFGNYLAKKLNDPEYRGFRTSEGTIGTK